MLTLCLIGYYMMKYIFLQGGFSAIFYFLNITWLNLDVHLYNGFLFDPQEELASSMLAHLPVSVVDVIRADTYRGGDLIILESTIARPSSQELANNFCWLKPIVLYSPRKVAVC